MGAPREGHGCPLSDDEQRISATMRRSLAPLPVGFVNVQLSVGPCHSTLEVEVQRGPRIVSVRYRGADLTDLFTDAQLLELAERAAPSILSGGTQ